MRIDGERESDNVEDRRGMSTGAMVGGGGAVLVIALVVYLLGGDPSQLLQMSQDNSQQTSETQGQVQVSPEEQRAEKLVRVTLASTEDVWTKALGAEGVQYTDPELILYRGRTQTGCGAGEAGMGPFYCPADQKIYIDLGFYEDLAEQFRAPGDFAQAYVIAHEVGHHVQNLLGISRKLDEVRGRVSSEEYNQLSVRLELQADFLAGVWAHYAQQMRGILEQGDLEEALTAANAIGDDAIQKKMQGRVVPAAFTHGTSAQRIRWFKKGFTTGDINKMDTFSMPYSQL